MTVDEEGVLSSVSGFHLGDEVLDVSIVVSHPVGEVQVERASRLLEVDGDLVDRFGSGLDGNQLTTDEVDSQNFVFVTS